MPRLHRGLISPNRPRQDARGRSRDATVSRSDRGTDGQYRPDDRGGSIRAIGPGRTLEARLKSVEAVSIKPPFVPVSPGGFSKQMSASSSVKSGSGAYLGPRSAVTASGAAQSPELLRPSFVSKAAGTDFSLRNREGERDRDQHVQAQYGRGRDRENRTAENKAVLSIVWFCR